MVGDVLGILASKTEGGRVRRGQDEGSPARRRVKRGRLIYDER